MLSRLRDVLTRHRRKFVITGVLVGGTFMALKYAQKKFIEMQERHAREFMEKTRRMQHFESTEKTCNKLIIGIATDLMQAILKECNTDELLEQLRDNPTNKLELWEEMKIVSFTRLTTFIYASSMLVVTLRIQLNLLGGYLYRDTVSALEEEYKTTAIQQKVNADLKQQYLLLIRYFIKEGGLSELVSIIRSKVKAIFKQLPLTKRLSLADIEQLFWSIQMSINSDPNSDPSSKLCRYMLPAQLPGYTQSGPLLEKMYNETIDLLESDDVNSVCANSICRGFSLAVDAIAEGLSEASIVSEEHSNEGQMNKSSNDVTSRSETLFNINNVQIALAKIIPIISDLTSKGFDSNTQPQSLATSLITFHLVSEKFKLLGANVYETFSSA